MNELINFCTSDLGTKIFCDTPSTDGYDVNNLLTPSGQGFLVYSCIKPPINIGFNFICNVKVSHIIIWPSVGSQKSTGFKISTICNLTKCHRFLSMEFLNQSQAGVVFYTKHVNEEFFSSSMNFKRKYLNIQHNFLNNLQVTIVKTQNSVPAINKIEIWGYCTSEKDFQKINKLRPRCLETKYEEKPAINPPQATESHKIELNESSVKIPDEFIDPITFKIMIQPMILPSGKVIDQSTLEKFENNEKIWGRSLSDPFTGVVFHPNCKPIFALALKCRIDKFLSENAEHPQLKTVPRLVNSKSQFHGFYSNVEEKSDVKKVETSRKIHGHIPKLSGYSNLNTKSVEIGSKITKFTQNNLDDNLKLDLNSILSDLRHFDGIKKRETTRNNICNCCEVPILYQLPCSHTICRKIIFSDKTTSQCPHCHINYKSSEVIKINF